MTVSPLPVLEDWNQFVGWLLNTLDKFPKKARFTFTTRIANLALDIVEGLVEARYSGKQHKPELLRRLNLQLEKMRLLVRLSHSNRYLANRAYEHCAHEIDNAGRQIGAWLKQTQGGKS